MASKTQIDRLGERLRKGDISDADMRMLDEYRRSFALAYAFVVRTIQNELRLKPTGRPAKSTTAIVEKLLRESIRLSQIQDIAGCRLIVAGIAEQEKTIDLLQSVFQNAIVVDRRDKPSHGYRAFHLVVNYEGKLVEIQVRTSLQHLWADWSEKLSDVVDPSIKYGGEIPFWSTLLQQGSELVEEEELLELQIADADSRGDAYVRIGTVNVEVVSIEDWRTKQALLREEVLAFFRRAIERIG